MNEVNLQLDEGVDVVLKKVMTASPGAAFIEIEHQRLTNVGDSLITIARKDPQVKELITKLATSGFYLYRVTDTGSRFVRDHTIGKLWHRVRDGDFQVNADGLVFSYSPPIVSSTVKRMLVIFSSMSGAIYNPSMMRYFEQNFRSAQKYVPSNTAILRIADIGGIVGAFYLNTTRNPDNVERVQRLICETAISDGISLRDVVLYGASKGGTGALFHGLKGGFKCVAVDPVLSDEYYFSKFNDSHFTSGGIFLAPKQEVFANLIQETLALNSRTQHDPTHNAVIYSENSPQFTAISDIAALPLQGRAAFFDCGHPEIKDHPDVSPKSLNVATMLMNMFFYDLDLKPGIRRVL